VSLPLSPPTEVLALSFERGLLPLCVTTASAPLLPEAIGEMCLLSGREALVRDERSFLPERWTSFFRILSLSLPLHDQRSPPQDGRLSQGVRSFSSLFREDERDFLFFLLEGEGPSGWSSDPSCEKANVSFLFLPNPSWPRPRRQRSFFSPPAGEGRFREPPLFAARLPVVC